MDQQNYQEELTIWAPVLDVAPRDYLNAYREMLGLRKSTNLICSRQYRGNLKIEANNCADIPEEENCRLWITGLPPTCTHSQLLSSIRGIGPVYASHITEPQQDGPRTWETSAASLTFFTADATNKFLAQHAAVEPFTVGGFKTKVIRHRIKTRGAAVNGRSRVLRIVGDSWLVEPERLHRVITVEWGVRYDTDFMQFTPGGAVSEVVWAFGSFRAQAHIIFGNINRFFSGRARAMYIADPCMRD
ncbi:hypothetical protein F5Y08DRAFT_352642 [Xylaria arbuscula]|nr:hypothetical protein F5Y08DRAFT_352642 [Xylaria arbuscula]